VSQSIDAENQFNRALGVGARNSDACPNVLEIRDLPKISYSPSGCLTEGGSGTAVSGEQDSGDGAETAGASFGNALAGTGKVSSGLSTWIVSPLLEALCSTVDSIGAGLAWVLPWVSIGCAMTG
jgi:hypothetical protein